MTQYIYPQNLKATANLWLWSLRDFVILAVAALLSVLALVQLHIFLPAVAVLCYGFLTIRMDDTTVAVKDLPCDIVPQLIQRTEDGRKSPAFVMRQQTGNIFKQQKRWSFNGGNSGDLKKESASCVILESSAEPCDTEGLTEC